MTTCGAALLGAVADASAQDLGVGSGWRAAEEAPDVLPRDPIKTDIDVATFVPDFAPAEARLDPDAVTVAVRADVDRLASPHAERHFERVARAEGPIEIRVAVAFARFDAADPGASGVRPDDMAAIDPRRWAPAVSLALFAAAQTRW